MQVDQLIEETLKRFDEAFYFFPKHMSTLPKEEKKKLIEKVIDLLIKRSASLETLMIDPPTKEFFVQFLRSVLPKVLESFKTTVREEYRKYEIQRNISSN